MTDKLYENPMFDLMKCDQVSRVEFRGFPERDLMVPVNVDFTLVGKEEWEFAKQKVDNFFAQISDEHIKEFNEIVELFNKIREIGDEDKKLEVNGYIYLLGSPEGYCKIGRAKELSKRLIAIGLQLPWRVEMLHSIAVSDPVWAERFLHRKFADCRMNGEWFLLSDSDILWIKSLTSLEPGSEIE